MSLNVVLKKFTQISSYDEWIDKIFSVVKTGLPKNDIIRNINYRDSLGSSRIDKNLILPHIVNGELQESYVVISQINKAVRYIDCKPVSNAIVVVSKPNDPSVGSFIDRLVDDEFIQRICNGKLNNQKLRELLKGKR
ncbi:PTS sugar transporter subunit IIA [Limosilactobacillus fermentum]|uniref:PTS sugar transporter subunit IIA n=1 Tax=Limosilactobacillus fermentum TaxID=1613 RepID=UPI003982AED1